MVNTIFRLRFLNLEGNRLYDKSVIALCVAISNKVGLVSLNLSKNYITDDSCEIISEML